MKEKDKQNFFRHVETLLQKTNEETRQATSNNGLEQFVSAYKNRSQTSNLTFIESPKKRKTKLTECSPTKKQKTAAKPIFKGLRFFFVEGNGLSKSRSLILKEKVKQRGGEVCSTFTKDVSHVISGMSYSNLCKHLKVTDLKNVFSPEWVTQCLIIGNLVDDETLAINTQASQPKEPESKSPSFDLSDISSSDEIISTSQYMLSETQTDPQFQTEEALEVKAYLACQEGSQTTENHNKEITDELDRLAKLYTHTGDQWRGLAYTKASSALKRHPKKITSGEEASKVRGVGKSIAEKIDEFLKFGHMKKLEELSNDELVRTLQLFCSIWGVGPSTAKTWYSQGFRTLDDIKTKAKLSAQQAIGLKYFEDFKQRIPREEVSQIEQFISDCGKIIRPNLNVIACGSYRRGKPDCGDIDILITEPGSNNCAGILSQLLDILKKKGFITDDLAVSHKSPEDEDQREMYSGVCKLQGYQFHRRIDIKVYPHECYPFALLYFTGNDYFNRSMRYYAHKNGFTLSDRALRKVIRVSNKRVKGTEGKPILCKTEADIFKAMGLDYKEPHEREI